jgi:hypothetical protein
METLRRLGPDFEAEISGVVEGPEPFVQGFLLTASVGP